MDVIDIIRDALKYPIDNYKDWTMVAILFFIIGLLEAGMAQNIGAMGYWILTIISIIIGLILFGLFLKIMKGQLNGFYEMNKLDLKEDFIGGIKLLIVSFIYRIIPTIIVVILAAIGGVFDQFTEMVTISVNATNATSALAAIPTETVTAFITTVAVIGIIGFILYVIFSLFEIISYGILAETESIGSALNIKDVSNRISEIGWGKYIVFIVAMIIVIFILSIIGCIVNLIPVVGIIISTTIVGSFGFLFVANAIGTIYRE